MKRFVVGIIAAAVLVSMARTAMAQTKTIASETRVETATVEAIEAASRTLTLKKPDGTYVVTVAGPDIEAVRGGQGRPEGQRSVYTRTSSSG